MTTNLETLEERVRTVAERLRALHGERERAGTEADALRQQVTELQTERDRLSGGLSEHARRTRIDEVSALLREAIEELRD